ncbi:MAG: O-antigen ligase family protein [Verrucomicrobiales bacterium]|nr:O-antigen ligase family protein [Verrucomicrobiales bacterium]
MTTQPPTHLWQTRGERLGEISLVLIGFTIPLSNALCTGVFPALAVVSWLMLRGWRDVPKLLRENRVALLCVVLFAWLGVAAIYGGGSEAFGIWKKYRELALIVIYMGLAATLPNRQRVVTALTIGLLLAMQISFMQAAGMLPMKHDIPVLSSSLTQGALMAWLAFWLLHYHRKTGMNGILALLALVLANLFFLVDSSTGVVLVLSLGLLFGLQTMRRAKLAVMAGGLIAVVVFAFAVSPMFRTATQEDVKAVKEMLNGKTTFTPTGERLQFYRNSLTLFSQAPVLGHGTGRFHEKYAEHVAGTKQVVTSNPHNEYLMVAVQSGLVGLGVLVALLWALWRAAFRWEGMDRWLAQGMAVWLSVGCCFNSFILDSREGMLFALLAGVYGAAPTAKKES